MSIIDDWPETVSLFLDIRRCLDYCGNHLDEPSLTQERAGAAKRMQDIKSTQNFSLTPEPTSKQLAAFASNAKIGPVFPYHILSTTHRKNVAETFFQ